MKNGLPVSYGTYRLVWTILDLALILTAAIGLISWFAHDGQGSDLVGGVFGGVGNAQRTIAHAIPFPWGQ